MTPNLRKTKVVVIKTKTDKTPISVIEQISSQKLLGVTFYEKVSTASGICCSKI